MRGYLLEESRDNEGIVVGHYNIGAAEFGYIATPQEEDDED